MFVKFSLQNGYTHLIHQGIGLIQKVSIELGLVQFNIEPPGIVAVREFMDRGAVKRMDLTVFNVCEDDILRPVDQAVTETVLAEQRDEVSQIICPVLFADHGLGDATERGIQR